jgi:hypothetical protein
MTAPGRSALATGSPPFILTEQGKIVASGGAVGDGFGYSVALSGDTAVVGSPWIGPTGSAYVFVRNGSTWSEQAKFLGMEPQYSAFGESVAISGDTVVIGAPRAAGTGSAYVFVRNGPIWSLQATLTPPDLSPMASFGLSVAIDGDTVIVGNPMVDWSVGSAYIFVRSGSGWSEQAKLVAPDGVQKNYFGFAVAISGDTVAVGAHGSQDFRGAAYLFVRSGSSWSEQAQLLAPEGKSWDAFGASIAISGDLVAVGAMGAENTGAAYVFRRTGSSWLQEARLLASDGREGGGLGASLALSGDTLAVGTDFWDAPSAYVFVRGTAGWYERAELLPSDLGGGTSAFGNAVAFFGKTVVVGAKIGFAPENNARAGTAYVFTLSFLPGVVVSPGSGLLTTEWGGAAQFLVVLNTQPTGNVVIDLESSDPGEGTISPAQLLFTPQDWFMPRTVTLSGVNDFARDGNQPYSAVVRMNKNLTTDPAYEKIDPPDPSVSNLGLEGDFYTITPCRVLDTRLPEQGPALASRVKRLVPIHGVCGIPATAGAVAINVTTVNPIFGGTLTLYPGDLAPPSCSTLTLKWRETLSSNAIVLLATDNTGTLAVWPAVFQSGSVHVIIDVSGYFE